MRHHTRSWRFTLVIIAILLVALIGGRFYLSVWLPRYVNHMLANLNGYKGSVKDIDIALYRGAYRIHELKFVKTEGNIPTPFIDVQTVDLSIQWSALLHGRIVSDIELIKPNINFAINKSGTVRQTGEEVDWTKLANDLMPIDINVVQFHDGKLAYRDFSSSPNVNIYIHDMSGELRNLRNVVDKSQPLPSTVKVQGTSIGGGALSIAGRMNILRPVPDLDLDAKIEGVALPALNSYLKAYAAVDAEKGQISTYSEMHVKNGRVTGYIKPIARDISLIDLRKNDNPVQAVWEAAVAAVVKIFTNQPRDQFATRIPLEGRLDNIKTNSWVAVLGILRNAFFAAVKKGFDNESQASSQ